MVAEGYGGTSAAEAEKFASAAFFKSVVLAVAVHFGSGPDVGEGFSGEYVSDGAIEAATGHQCAVREDGEVAVSAVAAVVDCVRIGVFGDAEESFFVKEEGPEVVFEVKDGCGVFVLFEFLPYCGEEVAIFEGGDVGGFFFGSGTVASKGEYVGFFLDDEVNEGGYFAQVCA